ncbi:aldehyde dehydrogenase family protein [Amycolatopsis jejuensis]|uniref:aldehyde dehydrogenase family protein n=1 Tax=Amycolatopsis jejuensis TaxID=330084 RepID=UPI000B05A61B|nr:aldehyde dehydrogenase family protein [Amycolatopsis jejuensis]
MRVTMTIGGQAVDTPAHLDVTDPATERVCGQAPDCSAEQLDAAFAAAATAFPAWHRLGSAERGICLTAAAGTLEQATDELTLLLTTEQGKPLAQARAEIGTAVRWLRHFAGYEAPPEVIQDDDEAHAVAVRRPLGVVGAITPWNYPISLAAWKIAPALAAGNTVVVKPSPYTPLTTLRVGELLRGVLPDGVLNVISGGDALGALMTRHPVPRKITFTGSTATGRKVFAAAADDLKRVTLELGGNDPAIVLDDADLPGTARKLFLTAFANSGQVCAAVKRVYAPRRLYSDLVDALVHEASTATMGDGRDPDVLLGPINNRPQLERVADLVADAVRRGAVAAAGGSRLDRAGYFFAPTVLAGASDGMPIVDEEQFGPALPVVAYDDLDEVVQQANTSHYGLAGSVWGDDVERAAEVASKLDCGTTWVNSHLALAPARPFGGAKWSGVGSEGGRWGYEEFTQLKVEYLARSGVR